MFVKICLSIFPFGVWDKVLVLIGVVGWRKVLGKLSVPRRPTSLNDSRARAYSRRGIT